MWIYLAATVGVLAVAVRRSRAATGGAVICLVWFVMANAGYERGTIEAVGTQVAAIVHLGLCVWHIRSFDHWLGYGLFAGGVGMILWTAYVDRYGTIDPYVYKLIKNANFSCWLGMVLLACWKKT